MISLKLVQALKESAPKEVNVLGNVTEGKLALFTKALFPIEVTPLGIVMLFNLEFAKA